MATSVESSFTAALLQYDKESGARPRAEDEPDWPHFGRKRNLFELIKDNPGITPQALKESLPGEDVDAVDPSGDMAALHYLVKGKYQHKLDLILTLLVFTEANIDLTTSQGKTPFHLAVESSDIGLMKNIAALGANINIPDLNKNTPLTTAILQREFAEKQSLQMKTVIHTHHYLEGAAESWTWGTGSYDTMEGVYCMSFSAQQAAEKRKTDKARSEMVQELKLIGALSSSELSAENSNRKGKDSEHSDDYSDGKSPPKPLHVKLEAQLVETLGSPDLDISPGLAIDIVKKLQALVVHRNTEGLRVLCLDGGGVRGLVQLEILRQIEERVPGKSIVNMFDYIVGTSTGGIIALAMVYGNRSIRELQKLYFQMKKDVFAKNGIFELGNTQKLEQYLKLWLGEDKRMDAKAEPKVLISTVHKKNSHLELRLFNNVFNDAYSKELVWEVARYTSAAPFYFTSKNNYVDGGLLANNPSEYALTAIQDHIRKRGLSTPVSLLVSVGAGINPAKEYRDLNISSLTDYVLKNVDLLKFLGDVILSHSHTAETNCHSRCLDQGIDYIRLSPKLDEEVDSGEIDNQKLLNMLWRTRVYMHSCREQVDNLAQYLKYRSMKS